MKKKAYEKPQLKAIEITNDPVLLSGSTPGFGDRMSEGDEYE